MYFATVVLFLLVCPAVSVGIEATHSHQAWTSVALIARWWAFWAVGIRLFVAGVRQVIQPRFTAEEIFGVREAGALPMVREIGFGNLSIGALGICSLFERGWAVPAAIVGGLYYGFAGLMHLVKGGRNAKEQMAMISDVFAAVVLLGCAAKLLTG
jgi:hypothetical protein